MTENEARTAIKQLFHAQWNALHSDVPVAWENTKPPSVDSSSGSHVRVTFVPAFSNHPTVGRGFVMEGWRVVLLVFCPLDRGEATAYGYAREIKGIFESAYANGLSGSILFPSPPVSISALRDPEIPAYRAGVSVPYQFQHNPS